MTNKQKSVLVIGAGISGATAANLFSNNRYHVDVIEKNNVVSGNCLTEDIDGIQVHVHGAHIFHTQSRLIWNYMNQFCRFNDYRHSVVAKTDKGVLSLPFNMYTFSSIFKGCETPAEARKHIFLEIEEERKRYTEDEWNNPSDLEVQALKLCGRTIYETLIKNYTEKQWGRDCNEIPASVITRIPFRFTYDNNYFNHKYQGIPINGYTDMIDTMLSGVKVQTGLEVTYDHLSKFSKEYDHVFYCGAVDDLIETDLEYRSLQFKHIKHDHTTVEYYDLGNSVVNDCTDKTQSTRSIDHRYFRPDNFIHDHAYITTEIPLEWKQRLNRYYSINNKENNLKHAEAVSELSKTFPKLHMLGRLAEYKYFDMDAAVMNAIDKVAPIVVKETGRFELMHKLS